MDENRSNTNDDNDLPKLSIEQENSFKKMKMSLESDAVFPKNFSNMFPPEVESIFLDSIAQFEQLYRNSKKVTIFEKIGSPKLKRSDQFSDEQIGAELKKLTNRMSRKGIGFRTEFEYPNRLIYDFIVNELFLKEIDDLQMDGLILHFSYEDFYPNLEEILKNLTTDFLALFLDKDSKKYLKKYSQDAKNYKQINYFRNCFEKFTVHSLEAKTVKFEDEKQRAFVHFDIDFKGKVVGTGMTLNYVGQGSISFKRKKDRWKLRVVHLPIAEDDVK